QHVWQVGVPDLVGLLDDRDAMRFLGGVRGVEQAELDLRGVLRGEGEIDTGAVPRGAEGVRSSRPNAHGQLVPAGATASLDSKPSDSGPWAFVNQRTTGPAVHHGTTLKSMRMRSTSSSSPRTPLGPYPQLRLYGQEGNPPSSNSSRSTRMSRPISRPLQFGC